MRATGAAAAAGGFRGVAAVLTTRCNLRCSYCYQRRDAPRTMSWPTLRAAIDLLLAGGATEPELSLTGGEPLLAMPMLRRAARYLDERAPPGVAPRLHVTTNGVALDGETLRFLARRRVKVVLSFDGVERAQALRGAGTFAVLDDLVVRLHRDFPAYFADDVAVSITLTSESLSCLADSARYFFARRVPSFDVAAVETHDPGWGDDSFAALDRQLEEICALSRAEYRRSGAVPFQALRPRPPRRSRRRDVPMCRIADGHGVLVDVDGAVVTCAVFAPSCANLPTELARRAAAAAGVGRVDDPDLPARLRRCRSELEQVGVFGGKERKRSRYGECGSCREQRSCLVCPLAIAAQPGNEDPDLVPPLPCALNLLTARHRRCFAAFVARQPSSSRH